MAVIVVPPSGSILPQHHAGIGAKGTVYKRFLHPKMNRKQIWPTDDKVRFSDVEVLNRSEKRIGGNKSQEVYDIRVPECCHFSVKTAPGTPFGDELTAVPAAGGGGEEEERRSSQNFNHPNMQRGATAEDIAVLRARGITVDNEDSDETNIVELLGSLYYKGVPLPRIPSVHKLGMKSRITQRSEHASVGPRGTYSNAGQSTAEPWRQYSRSVGTAQYAPMIRIPRNRAILDAVR